MVDPAGKLISAIASHFVPARQPHDRLRFSNLTSSIFLRRKSLEACGLFFDTQWRDLGDFYWLLDMIKRGTRMDVLDHYTSVFYETGDNMNLKPNAIREKKIKVEATPRWIIRTWCTCSSCCIDCACSSGGCFFKSRSILPSTHPPRRTSASSSTSPSPLHFGPVGVAEIVPWAA